MSIRNGARRSSGSGSMKRSQAASCWRGFSGSGGSPTRHGALCRAPLATRKRSATDPRCVTPCPTLVPSSGFGPWGDFASRIKGVVLVKTGDLRAGSTLLRDNLDEINDPDFGLWFLTGLTELAEALGHAGRIAEGLATIKRGIDQSQMSWLAPELLRIKGELL